MDAVTPIPAINAAHFEQEHELVGTLLRVGDIAACKTVRAIVGPEQFSEPMMTRLLRLICAEAEAGLAGYLLAQAVLNDLRPDVNVLATSSNC